MKIGIVAFSGVFPIHVGGPASVGYFIAKWLGEIDSASNGKIGCFFNFNLTSAMILIPPFFSHFFNQFF